jgi:enamine deaminase RidA (YjgF/YER057c/UK114 family)
MSNGRKLISSGSPYETEIGYSRAVVDGNWIFVSGTTGYNYDTMTISDDIAEQAEQCLLNINKALGEADASLADTVRVLYIVTPGEDFSKCYPVLKTYFGEVRPAITIITAGLLDPKMKIEIQVTAKKAE